MANPEGHPVGTAELTGVELAPELTRYLPYLMRRAFAYVSARADRSTQARDHAVLAALAAGHGSSPPALAAPPEIHRAPMGKLIDRLPDQGFVPRPPNPPNRPSDPLPAARPRRPRPGRRGAHRLGAHRGGPGALGVPHRRHRPAAGGGDRRARRPRVRGRTSGPDPQAAGGAGAGADPGALGRRPGAVAPHATTCRRRLPVITLAGPAATRSSG